MFEVRGVVDQTDFGDIGADCLHCESVFLEEGNTS